MEFINNAEKRQQLTQTNYQSMKALLTYARYQSTSAYAVTKDDIVKQLEINQRDVIDLKNLRDFAELYLQDNIRLNEEQALAQLYENIRVIINDRIRQLGGSISSVA